MSTTPAYRPFGDQYNEPDSRQDDHDIMDAEGARSTDTEDLPEAVLRARNYAGIFLKVCDGWRGYVPVDATVTGDRVYLQGVQMWRDGDAWHITDGDGGHWAFAAAGGAQ